MKHLKTHLVALFVALLLLPGLSTNLQAQEAKPADSSQQSTQSDKEAQKPLFEQLQQNAFPLSKPAPEKPDPMRLYREAIQKIADLHIELAADPSDGSEDECPDEECPEDGSDNTNYKKQEFLDKWGKPKEELKTLADADAAIRKALESLGYRFDGYSVPKQVEAMNQISDPTHVGIGVQIELKGLQDLIKDLPQDATDEQVQKALVISKEHPLMVDPFEGSPAHKAGIKKGDSIIRVDGKDVRGLTMSETIKLIKGKEGTKVKLTVERIEGGKTVEVEVEITRAKYVVPVVHLTDLGGGTWHLKLDNFMANNAAKEVHDALKKVVDSGGTKLIFDLRNNGGGRLDHAINIVQYMLPEGTIVVQELRDKDTDELIEQHSHVTWHVLLQTVPERRGILPQTSKRTLIVPEGMPIVVLVNGHSASASELVTGSLKFNRRARVVGTRTLGKGVGQQVVPLPYGRIIRITSFNFLPARHNINWVGVAPDVEVEAVEGDTDNQLETAKKVVQQMYDEAVARRAAEAAERKVIIERKKAEWKARVEKAKQAESSPDDSKQK